MKVLTITARNVEKAIEQGLNELGKTQDEVDIKIIEEGGFFKKAKVELYYEAEEDEKSQEEVKENKKEKKKQPKTEEKKPNTEAKEEKTDTQEEKVKSVDSDLERIEREFLMGLFEKMLVEAKIDVIDTEGSLTFNATGENVSRLIGKRGETLNAIQDLMSQVARKNKIRGKKVFFDVENYKNRREMALTQLAEKMSKKAIALKKPIRIDRLNAYERRIVHTVISNIEGVSTHSEGEEPHRHLIIIPDELD